jgi:hypothetical protein
MMYQLKRPSGGWKIFIAAFVAVLATILFVGYEKIFARDIPIYSNDEENFKYGSIGNDGGQGLPYAIWVALPELFPDHLPGPNGYASLGFRWEAGRTQADTPLGFSRARVGVERMSINCAFCHFTTFRRSPDAALEFEIAGAGNTIDVLGYQNFLTACARDPRFSADVLLPAMEQHVQLSWLDRVLYRFFLIPITRKTLLKQGETFAWTKQHDRPPWGPGRIDPFNPVKFDMLGLADDGTIGNSDMLAIWNLRARDDIRAEAPLHWDGLNNSIQEVVLSSALGDGMTAQEFGQQTQTSLRRIETFLSRRKPPASPYQPDPAAVKRGAYSLSRALFAVPRRDGGTDPHRHSARGNPNRSTSRRYVDHDSPQRLHRVSQRPRLGLSSLPET